MSEQEREREGDRRTEPRPEGKEPGEHEVAPPIEREHETQQGALEEDEKREPERR